MQRAHHVPKFLITICLFVAGISTIALRSLNGKEEGSSNDRIGQGRRKLTTSFSDTLAPRDICSSLMDLSGIIGSENDADSIKRVLPDEYALTTYVDYSSTGTQAMIVYSQEKRVAAVVFRGTEVFSLDDWTTNLNIDLVRTNVPVIPSDVELHEGYLDSIFATGLVDVFEKNLISLTNDPSMNVDHIYVTGHSMGGALAHIFGSYMAATYSDLKFRVITFGQPAVGNSSFKSWTENTLSNLSVFRFVNRQDAVPRILGLRYEHAGHLFQIQRRKSLLYYNQEGGGDYAGVPASWYLSTSLLQHTFWSYSRFFKRKASQAQFWPETFERVQTSDCKWWQFWCLLNR